MTRSDPRVKDEQVERLRSYFDDDRIVELTELVTFQNLSSKFNSALGVPAPGILQDAQSRNVRAVARVTSANSFLSR